MPEIVRARLSFAVISLTTFLVTNARAELADTREVTLSSLDQAKIGHTACANAHGVAMRFEALQYKSGSQKGLITVWVVCKAHGSQEGLPEHMLADCDNSTGAWTCAQGHLALGVKVTNGEVLLQPNTEVGIESAVEIIRYAWTQEAFQGQVFSKFMTSPCKVSHDIKSAAVLECGGWSLYIGKDCIKDTCSYHPLRLDGPVD